MSHLTERFFQEAPTGLFAPVATAYFLLHPGRESVLFIPSDGIWKITNFRGTTQLHTPHPKKGAQPRDYFKEKFGRYTHRGFVEVEAGDRVVDVGAFIGGFTIPAARRAREVISLEPSPVTFRCLEKNARRFRNIRRLNCAAWHEECVKELNLAGDPADHSLIEPDSDPMGDSVEVSAQRLDAIFEEHGWDAVEFLKMDAEGTEPEGLEGLGEYMPEKVAIDVGPERYGKETLGEVRSKLEREGYECQLSRHPASVVLFGRLKG